MRSRQRRSDLRGRRGKAESKGKEMVVIRTSVWFRDKEWTCSRSRTPEALGGTRVVVDDQVVPRCARQTGNVRRTCARVDVDVDGVDVIVAEGALSRWMLERDGRVVDWKGLGQRPSREEQSPEGVDGPSRPARGTSRYYCSPWKLGVVIMQLW